MLAKALNANVFYIHEEIPMKSATVLALLLLLICQTRSPALARRSNSADFEETQKLLDKGDTRYGKINSGKMVKANPNDVRWAQLYVRFRIHQNHLDEGVEKTARHAMSLQPRNSSVLTTFAMLQFFKRNFRGALDAANAALLLDKKNTTARMVEQLARSNIDHPPLANLSLPVNRSSGDEAIEMENEFDSSGPSRPEPVLFKTSAPLLKLAEGAGQDHDAYIVLLKHFYNHSYKAGLEKALNIWVKNCPKSAYALYKRGRFYQHFKREKQATDDYLKALEINPACAPAANRLALAYYHQKQYKEAVEQYDLAEQLGGIFPAGYGHRGECLQELKDYENAAKDFTIVLNRYMRETQPSRQIVEFKQLPKKRQSVIRGWWARRMETYFAAKKWDLALSDAKMLVILFPGYTRALDVRQKVYRQTGKYDLALKDLNTMIADSPRVTPWYRERADVLTKLGRTKEAQEDLKRAEKLSKYGSI